MVMREQVMFRASSHLSRAPISNPGSASFRPLTSYRFRSSHPLCCFEEIGVPLDLDACRCGTSKLGFTCCKELATVLEKLYVARYQVNGASRQGARRFADIRTLLRDYALYNSCVSPVLTHQSTDYLPSTTMTKRLLPTQEAITPLWPLRSAFPALDVVLSALQPQAWTVLHLVHAPQYKIPW
ncbi:hypothetical protein LIA77_07226 [Sarocladium implicatum]|nr:hypothetical protein LIA77_07226 [Sarocladium implicatum]